MSISEHRNRTGLAFLRSRYVARANYLADRTAQEFHDAIAEARAHWNDLYPEYRIVPGVVGETKPSPEVSIGIGLYWPPGLLPDWEEFASGKLRSRRDIERFKRVVGAQPDWTDVVRSLRSRFWNERYFLNPYQSDLRHPADVFISACVMFHVRTLEPEELIPRFSIEPQSLTYPPAHIEDRLNASEVAGQRDFLWQTLIELLANDPDRLDQIGDQAFEAGLTKRHSDFPLGPVPPPDSGTWWWYVPIIPGMSARDITDAAGGIAEHVVHLFGDRGVDALVMDLVAERMSRGKIADLLGVSDSFVGEAIKRSKS